MHRFFPFLKCFANLLTLGLAVATYKETCFVLTTCLQLILLQLSAKFSVKCMKNAIKEKMYVSTAVS